MVMEMSSPREEHVFDVRRTVTWAEAILTIWFGALQNPSTHLQSLCPWNPGLLGYTAWSSHHSLTMDVVQPVKRVN